MVAPGNDLIALLNSKGVLNKDTTDAAFRVFNYIKDVLQQFERQLRSNPGIDKRLKIQYTDRGTFETELKVADDVMIFIMHTNAFVFDASHAIWKSSYVKQDNSRATCGIISVYNFLSDSFKFDRKNDVGQLVARIFVNKEEHLFVEGKKQLNVLYNDFESLLATKETLASIIDSAIIYSLEIDVSVPPFAIMKEISVFDAMAYNLQSILSASKKLGFKFQNDADVNEE